MNTVVAFDLGKVLVDFDYSIAARKIAARSTMPLDSVNSFIGDSGITVKYELGLVTRREFFEQARQAIGFHGTFEEFGELFADIFTEIPLMIELHAGLRRRGVQPISSQTPTTSPSSTSAGTFHFSKISTATFFPVKLAP